VLAEIAAVGRILGVTGVVEFPRLENPDGEGKLRRDGERLLKFAARQARRIGNGRQGAVAEHLMRDKREKHRVHAAGIRHQARAVAFQQGP
jgi:hypothetical protein